MVEDPKAKGKAPPPKGGNQKGQSALEEITDNRARIINYVKNFGGEGDSGGFAVKITEEVAEFFEGFMMPITIWSVDRETQNETHLETYELDLSPLLY